MINAAFTRRSLKHPLADLSTLGSQPAKGYANRAQGRPDLHADAVVDHRLRLRAAPRRPTPRLDPVALRGTVVVGDVVLGRVGNRRDDLLRVRAAIGAVI